MEKIRVAFFADILIEEFDGASRTMFQLIRRIDPRRFEFLFICGTGPDTLAACECIRIPSLTLPFNNTYSVALPQLAGKALEDKLQAFAPDVVHIATPSLLGNYALRFAHHRGIPVLTIYHTHFISYLDYYLSKAPFLIRYARESMAAVHTRFYNQCDRIYVPSESIAREKVAMGVSPGRIMIWKRGIDTVLFNPGKRNPALMKRLVGNTRPVILFASRLVWEKNLETLIRIYNLCRQAELPYNFVIAGDGVARKACEQQMPGAVFLGKVDHQTLSGLYASADIFLFTSISETYGNVVAEAMASGLPCVIADGGGSADFVAQGENGFKCDPGDAADYVGKLRLVLENRAVWERFAAAGRALSLTLDWEQLAGQYFHEIGKMAGQLAAGELA
ncbi:glycosyltransferase family 4 protein [Dyadobacter sandarakinus]|uniref:Glycosyltransferase family 1 protein n=1 Tax=Dyadobacter sandarakinus TaxID=2747268 RepID=A0ABX7I1G1_9BACT|nr:glycosyltransferase family 1 protein [Dyadobacter sandarakinus]QRQ99898.1 glycosyltransferase family 1 protein [Dyadobacter sandarakinus]